MAWHGFNGLSSSLGTSLRTHVTVAKLHMIIRWLAWTCDAIDFFSVSLSIDRLERQFNRPAHDIVLYFKRRLITIDDSGADDFNHAHALIPITRRGASQFNPPTLS